MESTIKEFCQCVYGFMYAHIQYMLYSLTFFWGCEAESQIIIITCVIMRTLSAANRTTGTYSYNVSSGWSETWQHTCRGGQH